MSTTLENTQNNHNDEVVSNKHHNNKSLLSLAITAVVLFGGIFLLRSYIVKPFIVQGVSMYPTFDNWHYLIIDRATYNFFREPERGEVVVFQAPETTNRFFIKRVIGLPGETVIIDGQTVNILKADGTTISLNEPYIIDSKRKNAKVNRTLADNEYYMLGDNRLESADSRYWGPLTRDRIVGRPILRLFPLDKISWMPGDYEYK